MEMESYTRETKHLLRTLLTFTSLEKQLCTNSDATLSILDDENEYLELEGCLSPTGEYNLRLGIIKERNPDVVATYFGS